MPIVINLSTMLYAAATRYIPPAPFRVNAMHFETTDSYDNIVKNIINTMTKFGLSYNYPDSISKIMIQHRLDVSDRVEYQCPEENYLDAEIRIYKSLSNFQSYVVEFYRYGGDGFLLHNIYEDIFWHYDENRDEAIVRNHVIDVDNQFDNFDGLPLDVNQSDAYQALMRFN